MRDLPSVTLEGRLACPAAPGETWPAHRPLCPAGTPTLPEKSRGHAEKSGGGEVCEGDSEGRRGAKWRVEVGSEGRPGHPTQRAAEDQEGGWCSEPE